MKIFTLILIGSLHFINLFSQNSSSFIIDGKVINNKNHNPVPNILIEIPELYKKTYSDNNGNFTFNDIKEGTFKIRIDAEGYYKFSKQFIFNKTESIIIELLPFESTLDTIDVNSTFFKKNEQVSPGFTQVEFEEFKKTPGSVDDVVKYFQSSPGVSIPDDQNNELIVRGGSPSENLTVIDGLEVPNPNHFGVPGTTGGALCYINLRMVKDVDFFTGGLPVEFGDKLSSVMSIKLREGNKSKHLQSINLSIAGLGGLFEGPLFKNMTYLLSIRRSYFEILKNQFAGQPFPNYWDLNLKLNYDLGKNEKLTLFNLTAIDKGESFDNKGSSAYKRINTNLIVTGLNYLKETSKYSFNLVLGNNIRSYDVDFRSGYFINPFFTVNNNDKDISLKMNYVLKYSRVLTISSVIGGKYYMINDSLFFRGGLNYSSYIEPDIAFRVNLRTVKIFTGINLTGLFFGEKLKANLGFRLDYFDYINNTFTLSPRTSLSYKVNNLTYINASMGRYYQTPELIWILADPENRNLSDIRADNYVIGVEHYFLNNLRFNAEAYLKQYKNYPVGVYSPNFIAINSGTTAFPNVLGKAVSAGNGYISGIDFSLQLKNSSKGFYGECNLSLTKSGLAALQGGIQPAQFDCGLVFTLIGGYQIEKNWIFGLRVRYAGGSHYTPFDSVASYILSRGIYDFTKFNKERLPYYLRIDTRIDKFFQINNLSFSLYVEVQNLLNRKNVVEYDWDQKNNRFITYYQWSILPVVGFNLQF